MIIQSLAGNDDDGAKTSKEDTAVEESSKEEIEEAMDEAKKDVKEAVDEAKEKIDKEEDGDMEGLSAEEKQAYRSTENYLDTGMGFSRAGLKAQLTSAVADDYPEDVVEKAIQKIEDNGDVDWKEQAEDSAENYLDMGMGFSRAGLIKQLTSDAGSKFTEEEAEYAVNAIDVDWKEQAVKSAENYLETGMEFSKSGLIKQLTSDAGSKFTEEEAEYAVEKVYK